MRREICREQSRSRGLGNRAAEIAERLLGRLGQRPRMTDDEVDTLYESLGKIAARQRLGNTDAGAKRLRQRITEVLFEGLREGYPGAATGLRHELESGQLPEDVQKDAAERLKDFETTQPRKHPPGQE